MAGRSFWKGYLKLSLVTCPVAMTPAVTESEKVRFHTLNRKTGHRVASAYVDSATGKRIADEDEAKGYERGEGDLVILEDDELDAVALESARTIDVDLFAPADSIESVWLDAPHYLAPDDPVGEEAFCVIRDAMSSTRTVGVSRVVLYRRERAVLLQPRGKGIILWTLRFGDEVRDAGDYFGKIRDKKTDPALAKLVSKLIADRTSPWDAGSLKDPVQARLLDLIKAKKRSTKRPARTKPADQKAPPSNVVNIMDALRKSVGAEKRTKR